MHLIYIDDSYEKPTQTYAGIAVPASSWRSTFEAIQSWRSQLRGLDGIPMTKEFHATEFVAGRGRMGDSVVGKYRRASIFREAFVLLNSMPGIRVFSACRTDNSDWVFERLVTRIQRTMQAWDSHALLICDEGKEAEMTRLTKRLSVYNPVPVWVGQGRRETQNLQTNRILEDPFFKSSDRSYFIQMADFVAYALLRREQHLESKNRYSIHTCFDLLEDVVVRETSQKDRMGIIR